MQYAITLPAYMALLMLIVQAAIYFHAEHITAAAAAEAVTTAGVDGGTEDNGRDEATRILSATASGFLLNPAVEVSRDQDLATVRISGRVVSLLPFIHLTASSVAHGPVERLTAGDAR
ncbi:TadE/TadG family type IV pilus assembly protein [Catenulispora pinisilvae]|uniref:TadE/TadG family type IV pilus assembly protein n=1 Tax=Catenulispora pinisilvae TaxID=2705253 RepID=UPI001890DF64|nr:TadE/TadG family type IV pilus assembly protein [Catenulispora pinisilvae]